ncbi:MAG: DNA pilot protein [Microvirus sp.]|nr:MAG: DNA pilot protein [Microvirus sp.]
MGWLEDFGSSLGGGIAQAGQALGTAFTGLVNPGAFVAQQQAQAQRDTNMQNLQLTHEQWAREDSAVQRRAKDMSAAGVNPLLAAGSPASSAPAARMESPGAGTSAPDVGGIVGQLVGIGKTLAETALVNSQKSKTDADTSGLNLANAFAAEANPLRLTAMQLQNNFDSAANPTKLELLAKQMSGMDLDNINKELDSRLKTAGIDLTKAQADKAYYDMVEQRFRTGFDPKGFISKNGVDQYPLAIELASKLVALETAGIDLKNLQAFNEMTPGGTNNWLSAIKTLVQILGRK